MSERIVVIGGDAAGMSAASQALRVAKARGKHLEVVVVERGEHTSFTACGIPYWIAGDVDGPDALVVRTPDEHRANGIDVRMRTEAVALDLAARTVAVRDVEHGRDLPPLAFDQLVVATGAAPLRPPLPGIDAGNVHGVQTLDDGARLVRRLEDEAPQRAVIVGAGYIGIEMAEALVRRGLAVTVIDRAAEPMTTLDPELGAMVHTAMEGLGIDVVTSASVESIETVEGRAVAVRTADRRFPADVVVTALGVRPNTAMAEDAGLPVGESKGLLVDDRMAVRGHDGIWAAGDCVESLDRLTGESVNIALGTHANRQGRILGTNLAGGDARYPGLLGTAISKVCGLEIARTGLGERAAADAGFDAEVQLTRATTTSGYFPGAEQMTVKLVADRDTGRLLGAQVVGGSGAGKRVDTFATAIWASMTVAELAMVDLSYAPPFSPTFDAVTISARRMAERLELRRSGRSG